MKEIFISHAEKDKKIIGLFLDLILSNGLNISIDHIFCTSIDGTEITSGENWRKEIQSSIAAAKINFIIISPNYKESEMCMNEMGAIWMTNSKVITLIIEPINYKTVGILLEPTQIEKLLNEESLDRIKDELINILNLPQNTIKSDRWTKKKKEFILNANKHLKENPFKTPIDRTFFESTIEQNQKLTEQIETILKENQLLSQQNEQLKNLKDKEEVTNLNKEHLTNTEYDDFQNSIKEVSQYLNKLSPIIIGLIFKDFSKKDISIDFTNYNNDLDDAIANDYIIYNHRDDEYAIDWEKTNLMQKLKTALQNVKKIIEEIESESFSNGFSEDYGDIPLDIKNKNFWIKVFSVSLRIN